MVRLAGRPLLAGSAIIGAIHGVPASAQRRTFDVPAGDAVRAIPEFARQADVQILVSDRTVRGRPIAALHGTMPVRAAIRRLLRGTGLRAVSIDAHTYTIVAERITPIVARVSAVRS